VKKNKLNYFISEKYIILNTEIQIEQRSSLNNIKET